MRVPQKVATKGSQRWIQGVAEDERHPVALGLRANLRIGPEVVLDWRSPRADDDFAEYRDASFLTRLDLGHLVPALRSFWPSGGPQWDALARASDGRVFLVEAKAHIAEMASSCQASAQSLAIIEDALGKAKAYYGAKPASNWLSGFYQYANRLAHVQFLRDNRIDAHLVNVYFLGDEQMHGPQEIAGWAKALDDCRDALGITRDDWPFVHHLFVRISTDPVSAIV